MSRFGVIMFFRKAPPQTEGRRNADHKTQNRSRGARAVCGSVRCCGKKQKRKSRRARETAVYVVVGPGGGPKGPSCRGGSAGRPAPDILTNRCDRINLDTVRADTTATSSDPRATLRALAYLEPWRHAEPASAQFGADLSFRVCHSPGSSQTHLNTDAHHYHYDHTVEYNISSTLN